MRSPHLRCGREGQVLQSYIDALTQNTNRIKVAATAIRVLHGIAPPYLNQLANCRRPAQSLPTSVSFVTPTARATIPANNCRSTYIPSCCISPLELIAIRHSSIFICLPSVNVSKHFSSASLFLTLFSDYTTSSWSMQ